MELETMVYISLLAFTGLIFGGLLGAVINKLIRQVNKIYVYAGSLLLGLILFEIIPESSRSFDWIGVAISVLIGIVLMHQIHLFTDAIKERQPKHKAISYSTIFLVIAVAIHNLPSGIAISSNSIYSKLSNELVFSFIIHQIPEGLALFLSLVSAGSVLYSTISFTSFSFLLIIFFFLALVLGQQPFFQDSHVRATFIGISIGTLGYVSVLELLLKSYSKLRPVQFFQYVGLGLFTIVMYVEFVQIH
ncbi:ZIP family metal transporter [Aquibacillus salsiterrae]|uniref:ZIP family metal transporter n=1 Tax=Aquibacillus salsiterrae TaxID=2950439 RepID=A0A9X4AEG5_9BACI|nr:ZIP family metal transporter [Aquibacillus salsiterrae]MDC3416756.1 ZIP family metal transporter [Aquibacillus salsiterrae]